MKGFVPWSLLCTVIAATSWERRSKNLYFADTDATADSIYQQFHRITPSLQAKHDASKHRKHPDQDQRELVQGVVQSDNGLDATLILVRRGNRGKSPERSKVQGGATSKVKESTSGAFGSPLRAANSSPDRSKKQTLPSQDNQLRRLEASGHQFSLPSGSNPVGTTRDYRTIYPSALPFAMTGPEAGGSMLQAGAKPMGRTESGTLARSSSKPIGRTESGRSMGSPRSQIGRVESSTSIGSLNRQIRRTASGSSIGSPKPIGRTDSGTSIGSLNKPIGRTDSGVSIGSPKEQLVRTGSGMSIGSPTRSAGPTILERRELAQVDLPMRLHPRRNFEGRESKSSPTKSRVGTMQGSPSGVHPPKDPRKPSSIPSGGPSKWKPERKTKLETTPSHTGAQPRHKNHKQLGSTDTLSILPDRENDPLVQGPGRDSYGYGPIAPPLKN